MSRTARDEIQLPWRDLMRRAWLTLTVECPNDPLNDELAAALAQQANEK